MRQFSDSEEANIAIFGRNVLTPPVRESVFKQFIGKFADPIIKILAVAAGLQLIIGDVAESMAVIFAILLCTVVAFVNEYRSQKNFDILNKTSDDVLYKVLKDGNIIQVAKKDIIVGDIIELSAGEEVPADCKILESSSFSVMEDMFTGESKPVKKSNKNIATSQYRENQILRGSMISTGIATVEVGLVGDKTEIGKLSIDASIDNGIETPLNKQLNKLADNIGIAGTFMAFTVFFCLAIKHLIGMRVDLDYNVITSIISVFFISIPILGPAVVKLAGLFAKREFDDTLGILEHKLCWIISIVIGIGYFSLVTKLNLHPDQLSNIVNYFMIAVTIIVVAVPEGLPMATVISMAYAMKKMFKDNNLVRKLHACETAGACTAILSDKTGTLTKNKMTVVRHTSLLPNDEVMLYQAVYNCTADIDNDGNIVGNPTEGAILLYALKDMTENKGENIDYKSMRKDLIILNRELFDSEKKYMSTTVEFNKEDSLYVKLIKGAPDVIIGMCESINGKRVTDNSFASEIKAIKEKIELEQSQGCRVLAFAQQVAKGDVQFTGYCVITDPIREGVPTSISKCINAGIKPIMVTGDGKETAIAIAGEAGIKGIAISGSDLETMSDFAIKTASDKIGVVYRAKPEHKKRLAKLMQEKGHIIAVTGDGTNDAPALKQADVGLSMGAGTSVAKEASDIVLLDNSFSSFVTAVKWGRSIYKNIQKFLVFQLSINVAALVIALIGPFINIEMPFTVIQMLWINLIMDTLAALALATEPPHEDVLLDKPRNNNSFIITKAMGSYILGFSAFLIAFMMFALNYFKANDGVIDNTEMTYFFNLFIFINVFNLLKVRTLGRNVSIFNELFKSKQFVIIFSSIILVQILITEIGGSMFRLVTLDAKTYLEIIGISIIPLIAQELISVIKRIFKL